MSGSERRGVVHTRSVTVTDDPRWPDGYVSGRLLAQAEGEAARWRNEGYSVTAVPADGRDHPRGKPCPICSTEGTD